MCIKSVVCNGYSIKDEETGYPRGGGAGEGGLRLNSISFMSHINTLRTPLIL